jgi:hypothetical protein
MMGEAPAFFVSYTKVDVSWAEWIALQLKDAGYSVIFQRWHFRPGTNWVLAMHDAARMAQRTLLVLSPDSLEAPYVQQEIAAAFADDPLGRKRKLIPVRIRDCQPDGLLKTVEYIDLVGRTEIQARELLITGVSDYTALPSHVPFPGAHDVNAAEPVPFPGLSTPAGPDLTSASSAPTVRVAPLPAPDLATLRRQLDTSFDDSQFDAFCLDHFSSVYQRFSGGMDRDRKTTMLLDYCRKTRTLDVLWKQLTGEAH